MTQFLTQLNTEEEMSDNPVLLFAQAEAESFITDYFQIVFINDVSAVIVTAGDGMNSVLECPICCREASKSAIENRRRNIANRRYTKFDYKTN